MRRRGPARGRSAGDARERPPAPFGVARRCRWLPRSSRASACSARTGRAATPPPTGWTPPTRPETRSRSRRPAACRPQSLKGRWRTGRARLEDDLRTVLDQDGNGRCADQAVRRAAAGAVPAGVAGGRQDPQEAAAGSGTRTGGDATRSRISVGGDRVTVAPQDRRGRQRGPVRRDWRPAAADLRLDTEGCGRTACPGEVWQRVLYDVSVSSGAERIIGSATAGRARPPGRWPRRDRGAWQAGPAGAGRVSCAGAVAVEDDRPAVGGDTWARRRSGRSRSTCVSRRSGPPEPCGCERARAPGRSGSTSAEYTIRLPWWIESTVAAITPGVG